MARKVIALMYTDPPVINEQDAAKDAITPGHLVQLDTPSGVKKNTTAGARVPALFALEREELGQDIDSPYAVGDQVKVGHFHQGQRVYAFLASGENVARGEYLQGDNAGALVGGGTDGSDSVAVALEAVDNSGGANPRIRCSVI